MKNVFLIVIVNVAFILQSMAQVPAYVPTDSLVGWFPFNGNANDLSGKNNHLTNYGASLTNDRFNNYNSAYNVQPYTRLGKSKPISNFGNVTFAFWIYTSSGSDNILFETGGNPATTGFNLYLQNYVPKICLQYVTYNVTNANSAIGQNTWYFIAFTKQANVFKMYINGVLTSQGTSNSNPYDTNVYFTISAGITGTVGFSGNIDDLGIWNRTLSQAEISSLYNACAGNYITKHPNNQLVSIGSNTNFITSAPSNSIYQWQTNIGRLGWIDVADNVAYSGSADDTLSLQNVQLYNHLQKFRVITSLNNCLDTSLVATLTINDTCVGVNDTTHLVIYDTNIINDTNYVTINDTIYISVTDTLIIKIDLNITPPHNLNYVKMYPNPAKDHLTIDFGNYTNMSSYFLKIYDVSGQIIYYSLINQQYVQLDLSTWTGKGIYFVQIIDAQTNVVETRKIVLE